MRSKKMYVRLAGVCDRKPAVIRINYGLQRHRGGGMSVRTLLLPRSSAHGVIRRAASCSRQRNISAQLRCVRASDLMPDLPAQLTCRARRPAARLLIRPCAPLVYNSNPAAVAPDQAKVLEGLRPKIYLQSCMNSL